MFPTRRGEKSPHPIHSDRERDSLSCSLEASFARSAIPSSSYRGIAPEVIHELAGGFFHWLRDIDSFPMSSAASISAVTASFSTLLCQKSHSGSNSAARSMTVALPAFHGLKVSFPSGAPSADLRSCVAAQCAAASSGSSSSSSGGVVSMGCLEAGVGMMGTKMGMMTVFTEDGKAVPCTVVGFHEGNIVTQVKSDATDGYTAVQVGYRRVRDRKLTKPQLGHLNKVGAIPMRHLQEFRVVSAEGYEPNQVLQLEEIFKEGDLIDVVGNSIGKGFQGQEIVTCFFAFFSGLNSTDLNKFLKLRLCFLSGFLVSGELLL